MTYPAIRYDEEQRRELAHDDDVQRRERFSERPVPVAMNVTVACPVCQRDHVTARFDIVDGAPDFRGLATREAVWWACHCRESAHVDMDGYVADVRATAWDRAAEWLRLDKIGPQIGQRAKVEGVFPHWGRS